MLEDEKGKAVGDAGDPAAQSSTDQMADHGQMGNPWAICGASVGQDDKEKFESCVLHVKKGLGLPDEMTEEQFLEQNGEKKEDPAGGVKNEPAGDVKDEPKDDEPDKMSELEYGELKGIEIFSTGTFRDKEFTEKDLDKIVKNFDILGAKIQPPMVLGHGEKQELLENSGLPAIGWVNSVYKRKVGDATKLVADFSDVPDAAREAIQKKAYKRVSVELYEDFEDDGKHYGLTLRRVALLGADIPEVKNLADVVALSDNGNKYRLYSEEISMNATANDIDKKVEPATIELPKDVLKLAERVKGLEAENKQSKAERDELAKKLAKADADKRQAEVETFVEKQEREGILLPKHREMGIVPFLASLDSEKTIKFGEDEDKKPIESTASAWMKKFIESLPKAVEFGELAPYHVPAKQDDDAMPEASKKSKDLDSMARKEMDKAVKEGRKMSYTEAVKIVARRRPDLVEIR